MSIKTVRIDDLEENEVPADETVQIGLDGKWVELDLSSKNATRVRNTLAPWMSAGRVAARPAPVRATTARASASREQKIAVREWARKKGLNVSHKGRIPQDIQDAFDAEHAREGHPVRVAEPAFSASQ